MFVHWSWTNQNIFTRTQTSLKIMFRDLQTESPHIFNIQILISSGPWALFGSRLLIIRRVSSFVKLEEGNLLSVHNGNSEGRTFLFEIGEHWSAKKELKILLFLWKSTIYLSPWNRGGMQGIFFPFNSFQEWPVALTSSIWIT